MPRVEERRLTEYRITSAEDARLFDLGRGRTGSLAALQAEWKEGGVCGCVWAGKAEGNVERPILY